jgi:uncharacterized protein
MDIERQTMKILVLCDDRWHPAQTVRQGLAGLESQGFAFEFIEDARQWSIEIQQSYPLTILSKSNNVSSTHEEPWMTDEVQAALWEYIDHGNGLLAIHSGTAGYEEARVLRSLLGGVFLRHPEQCPVTCTPRDGHPLVAGSGQFTHKDEYYIMALDDTQADVFLTASCEHGEQPAGWTRSQGAGRVCVLTPGHNLPVWQDPSYQALIANALLWCSQTS